MSAKKSGRPKKNVKPPVGAWDAIRNAIFPPDAPPHITLWLQRLEQARLEITWPEDEHHPLDVRRKRLTNLEAMLAETSIEAIRRLDSGYFRELADGIQALASLSEKDRRERVLVADCWGSLAQAGKPTKAGDVARLANHHGSGYMTASRARDIMESLGIPSSIRQEKSSGDK